MTSLKILVTPLDWGLGHTTRCLSLIDYLIKEGHQVVVAAEGHSAMVLRTNFPELALLPLKGYRITYSKKRQWFVAKLLTQVPKILRAISREYRWLKQQQVIHHFDAIISDNRYGCFLNKVPSVLLTHQLQIQTNLGSGADKLLRLLHYRLLRNFQQVWIVDTVDGGGLSGKLAHPEVLPPQAKYIGLLSQFTRFQLSSHLSSVQDHYILALLSGPEPMRSQLEHLLLQQMASLPKQQFIVVAGRPPQNTEPQLPPNVRYHNQATGRELYQLIHEAELVICRSGYSSLMDLALLHKKALLIPTPGQSEQEYLARHLKAKMGIIHRSQAAISLSADLPKVKAAPSLSLQTQQDLMNIVLNDWLLTLVPESGKQW